MEKLQDYTFNRATTSRYPWDQLLDGGIYRMSPVDLELTSAKNFRIAAYAQAKRRGLKVRTTVEADGSLVMQAYPREA